MTLRALALALVAIVAAAPGAEAGAWHYERATYYGGSDGYFGSSLACGGRLTPWTRGVAHRTLPCGTRIEIRHGGYRVVVRVVDRGPYGVPWQLDLTYRTARDLRGGRAPDSLMVSWRVVP